MLFDSSQVDFISGKQAAELEPIITLTESGRYHLFPSERFDDAMICLEALYPDDFGDCSYGARSNESKKDQDVTPETMERVEQLPWIQKDRELNAYSHRYLDKLVSQLFPEEGQIEEARRDFRRRCDDRKPMEEVIPKVLTLKSRLRRAAKFIVKGY